MTHSTSYKQAARRAAIFITTVTISLVGVWALPRVSSAAAGWVAAPPVREQTVRLGGGLAVAPAVRAAAKSGTPAADEPVADRSTAGAPGRVVDAGFRFDMVGLLCDDPPPGRSPFTVSLRTSPDGRAWGPWLATDLVTLELGAGGKPDGPDGLEASGTPGAFTEPVWVGSARYVELRADAPEGSDSTVTTLKGVRVMFLNTSGDGTVGDRLASTLRKTVAAVAGIWATPAAEAMTTAPTIVRRAQWGANESWRGHAPEYAPVKMAFIHHTVNSNSYTRAQAPGIVRGIYYYNTKGLKWSDLGYNFLVDRYGTVYEGRYGGITKGVIGAQTLGFNTGSTGIAMIGTFTSPTPPSAMMSALRRLLAWKLDVHHVDPRGSARMVCRWTQKFKEGATVVFPVIAGHRQANYTACPGDALYRLLPGVRTTVGRMGLPKIYDYVVGTVDLSPNGDGVHETTRVRFRNSETADWTIDVKGKSGAVVRRLTGRGDSVDVRWDGRDDSGAVVPDGKYRVVGRARARGGQAREATVTVSVDTVAPSTTALAATPAVSSPNGDGYADRCRLRFTTSEACSARVSVVSDTGAVLRAVTGWQYAPAVARAVAWDGRVSSSGSLVDAAEGEAIIRLELKDPAGNRSTQTAIAVLDRTLGFLTARPGTFSPNGDGVKDATTLGFSLTRLAAVTVEITRDGKTVRRLEPGGAGAGAHTFVWDGLLADGARATSGKYRYRATATSTIGTVGAARWVTVDRYRPRLSAPSGVVVTLGKSARVTYSVRDPYSGKVHVTGTVRNRYGTVLATLDCGWIAVDRRTRLLWRPSARRTYTLTLTAVDRGGNRQYAATRTKISAR